MTCPELGDLSVIAHSKKGAVYTLFIQCRIVLLVLIMKLSDSPRMDSKSGATNSGPLARTSSIPLQLLGTQPFELELNHLNLNSTILQNMNSTISLYLNIMDFFVLEHNGFLQSLEGAAEKWLDLYGQCKLYLVQHDNNFSGLQGKDLKDSALRQGVSYPNAYHCKKCI